jgi:hypothetical protein
MCAVLKVAVAKPAATLAAITAKAKNFPRRSKNATRPNPSAVTIATGNTGS